MAKRSHIPNKCFYSPFQTLSSQQASINSPFLSAFSYNTISFFFSRNSFYRNEDPKHYTLRSVKIISISLFITIFDSCVNLLFMVPFQSSRFQSPLPPPSLSITVLAIVLLLSSSFCVRAKVSIAPKGKGYGGGEGERREAFKSMASPSSYYHVRCL